MSGSNSCCSYAADTGAGEWRQTTHNQISPWRKKKSRRSLSCPAVSMPSIGRPLGGKHAFFPYFRSFHLLEPLMDRWAIFSSYSEKGQWVYYRKQRNTQPTSMLLALECSVFSSLVAGKCSNLYSETELARNISEYVHDVGLTPLHH